MITVTGGTPAMQAMQDGAYQEATLIVYDVSQSGSPELIRFGNDSIIAKSLVVSKSCASNGVLELGSAVSDELQVSLKISQSTARSLKGNTVNLIVSWEYGANSPESLYEFSGVITDVKRASEGVYKITALDAMIVFNAPYRLSELMVAGTTTPLSFPVSVINLMRSIVWSKGAPYIDKNTILTSQAPINSNANATVSDIPEGKGYTYRQILQWCAQWMGVNLRIAASATPALEMWLWSVPSQIGDITDCSDEPYGITTGNTYKMDIDETELLAPQFTIVSGESYLYGLGNLTSYPGIMSIKANPIILRLYSDYYLAFQAYAGNLHDRIDDAFINAVGSHFAGSFRTTPRWYLQPGDFVVSVTTNGASAHVVTSVSHNLNGHCAITAGGFEIGTSDDSGSTIPAFSEQQSNELTTRLQDICFYPGEVFDGYTIANGIITTGSTEINLVCPLNKFIPKNVRVDITTCEILLREPSGYYIEATSFTDVLNNIDSTARLGTSLRINLKKSGGWKNSQTGTTQTNNVPLAGNVRLRIAFY